MNILWINEVAELTGGCERYIADTASLLRESGFINSFLYDVQSPIDTSFLKVFDCAFPMVDLRRQITELKPDLIYVHRLSGDEKLKQLLSSQIPVIRFYHDHKLFCLREHKYTTLMHKTCTKPIGLRCYGCLGMISRKAGFPFIGFNCLSTFHRQQQLNKKLNGFVVGSEYMKEHLIAHGFEDGKIYVNPLYSVCPDKADKPKQRKDFLFAGQLVRGKGVDVLLRAFADLKTEHKLIICGSGRQEQKFKNLADKLGLGQRVDWKGKVDGTRLAELYASSLCFVMPSRSPETFGLSGLEAMSNSMPVVASKVGGIGQWLKDGLNGFAVPPNNPGALKDALEKIINAPDNAKQMGEEGSRIFEEQFKPENHINKLIGIFEKVIKTASRKGARF